MFLHRGLPLKSIVTSKHGTSLGSPGSPESEAEGTVLHSYTREGGAYAWHKGKSVIGMGD